MHWYQSATTDIYLQLKNLENLSGANGITIPMFTMLTDLNSNTIYTKKVDDDIENSNPITISTLKSNLNKKFTVKAIEGRCKSFEINNNKNITLDMLDSNYRLYFDESNVAENGVFIKSTEDQFWHNWKRVDNLQVQRLGTRCYKFGVLPETNTCYIEFPEDIASLLNNDSSVGLNINYILSSGSKGNIKSSYIKTFLDDITTEVMDVNGNTETITVTNQISVVQPNGTINGMDPETLDDAYRNFKRTIGTFNTLVTTKDYENAIYNAKAKDGVTNLVSNVIVSDRTSDLNSTLKVLSWSPSYSQKSTLVLNNNTSCLNMFDTQEAGSSANQNRDDRYDPALSAYDIVFYTLDAGDGSYESTFLPNEDVYLKSMLNQYLEENKSVQHNILSLNDLESIENALYYIYKNIYALKGQLITYERVSAEDAAEIEANVMSVLRSKYNSRNIDFGDEVEYATLLDTIQNADSRIKSVALDLPKYQITRLGNTKANTQINFGSFYNANSIDSSNELINFQENSNYRTDKRLGAKTLNYDEKLTLVAKMILAGNVQLFKFDNNFTYDFGLTNVNQVRNQIGENHDEIISDVFKLKSATTETKIHLKPNGQYHVKNNELIQAYAPNYVAEKQYTNYVKVFYKNIDFAGCMRETTDETISSTRQYYIQVDNTSNSSDTVSYKQMSSVDLDYYTTINTYSITQATLESYFAHACDPQGNVTTPIYELEEILHNVVGANRKAINLSALGEKLNNLSGKTYKLNGEGEVQTLPQFNSPTVYCYDASELIIKANKNHIVTGNEKITLVYTDSNGVTQKDEIKEGTIIQCSIDLAPFPSSDYESVVDSECTVILTTQQSFSIMKLNQSEIINGSKVYWILNNTENVLDLGTLEANTAPKEIILQENEYFLYQVKSSSDTVILGQGTKIALSPNYFENGGVKSFNDKVKKLNINDFNLDNIEWYDLEMNLVCTEMDIVTAGPDAIVTLEPNENNQNSQDHFVITNQPQSLNGYTFKVQDTSGSKIEVNTYPIKSNGAIVDEPYVIQSRLGLAQNSSLYQILENDGQQNDTSWSEQSITFTYEYNNDSENNIGTQQKSATIVGPKKLYFTSIVLSSGGENIDLSVLKDGKQSYSLEVYTFDIDNHMQNIERKDGIIKVSCAPTNTNENNQVSSEGLATSIESIDGDPTHDYKYLSLPVGFSQYNVLNDESRPELGYHALDASKCGWFIQFYLASTSEDFYVLFTTTKNDKEYLIGSFGQELLECNTTNDHVNISGIDDEYLSNYKFKDSGSYVLWVPNSDSYEKLNIYMLTNNDNDIISIGNIKHVIGFNEEEINVIPDDHNNYSVYDYFNINDKLTYSITNNYDSESIEGLFDRLPSEIKDSVEEGLSELPTPEAANLERCNRKCQALNNYYSYDILRKINELIANSSNPKVRFDYTTIVNDQDKVLQPTLSSSYFNKNHFANRFTIPEINFNNSSIKVNSYSILSTK